jgi:hypothetical protein
MVLIPNEKHPSLEGQASVSVSVVLLVVASEVVASEVVATWAMSTMTTTMTTPLLSPMPPSSVRDAY